jgi:hypothetical protein
LGAEPWEIANKLLLKKRKDKMQEEFENTKEVISKSENVRQQNYLKWRWTFPFELSFYVMIVDTGCCMT